MRKIMLIYGGIAGVAIISTMIIGLSLSDDNDSFAASELLGYLVMIVALSMIFVGIKRYRDRELGGVIRFGHALALGLGISAVASVVYVVAWEVNLAMTDYAFYEEWARGQIEARKAAGVSAEELAAFTSETMKYSDLASQPVRRVLVTLLEIFPVGLLVSLISAAILRNSKVLPASA